MIESMIKLMIGSVAWMGSGVTFFVLMLFSIAGGAEWYWTVVCIALMAFGFCKAVLGFISVCDKAQKIDDYMDLTDIQIIKIMDLLDEEKNANYN